MSWAVSEYLRAGWKQESPYPTEHKKNIDKVLANSDKNTIVVKRINMSPHMVSFRQTALTRSVHSNHSAPHCSSFLLSLIPTGSEEA